jgi:hypothetical protein
MTDQPEEPSGDEEVAYELDDWAAQDRDLLDRLLTTNGVAHAWQGGTLSVGSEDEAVVDALIDEIAAASLPGLDPEAAKVVYEVAEWSPEDRADLVDALTEEGVRHAFDEMGDLLVEEIDEDRVDLVIAELVDDEEAEVDDAPEASEVLSALFVAADKLRKNPRDGRTIGQAIDGATTVVAMSPPYGIDRATWAKVGLRAGALRRALEDEAPDDDAVVAAAEELRDLLHPMV